MEAETQGIKPLNRSSHIQQYQCHIRQDPTCLGLRDSVAEQPQGLALRGPDVNLDPDSHRAGIIKPIGEHHFHEASACCVDTTIVSVPTAKVTASITRPLAFGLQIAACKAAGSINPRVAQQMPPMSPSQFCKH